MKSKLELDSSNFLKIESSNEIGYQRQKSFSIYLSDIKIVGIKGEMQLDDEHLYICLINRDGVSNNVNSYFLDENSIGILIKHFGFSTEYFKITGDFYENFDSLIFYPKDLKGKKLYKKWNTDFRSISNYISRLFQLKHASEGVLSEEAISYLESCHLADD